MVMYKLAGQSVMVTLAGHIPGDYGGAVPGGFASVPVHKGATKGARGALTAPASSDYSGADYMLYVVPVHCVT